MHSAHSLHAVKIMAKREFFQSASDDMNSHSICRSGLFKRPVLASAVLLTLTVSAVADRLPLIDAHSQIDQHVDPADIVRFLDAAGIARVILAARGKVKASVITALARDHPDRITAAVRTKGGPYKKNAPRYYEILKTQLAMPEFAAMAETILWHAEKQRRDGTTKAAEVIIPPDDDRVRSALQAALRRGWPFIFHIEFAAAGTDADRFMAAMETTLDAHPGHPFALIHMGQLEPAAVGRLIESHPNLYFITSHATPITTERSRQPWVNMFDGDRLTPTWRDLIVRHPDRFILGFDNVWANHWGERYEETAALWRNALKNLPDPVAHAVAHRNAERLWRLPPLP